MKSLRPTYGLLFLLANTVFGSPGQHKRRYYSEDSNIDGVGDPPGFPMPGTGSSSATPWTSDNRIPLSFGETESFGTSHAPVFTTNEPSSVTVSTEPSTEASKRMFSATPWAFDDRDPLRNKRPKSVGTSALTSLSLLNVAQPTVGQMGRKRQSAKLKPRPKPRQLFREEVCQAYEKNGYSHRTAFEFDDCTVQKMATTSIRDEDHAILQHLLVFFAEQLNFETLLAFAVSCKKPATIRLLLQIKPDISGATAVHLAVLEGDAESFGLLISYDHIRQSTDHIRLLTTALKGKNYIGICVILEWYTDPNHPTISSQAIAKMLKEKGDFEFLLKTAVNHKKPAVIQFLLQSNPHISGATAVDVAVREQYAEGFHLLFGHDYIRKTTDHIRLLKIALRAKNYIGICIVLEWYTDPNHPTILPQDITNLLVRYAEPLLVTAVNHKKPTVIQFLLQSNPLISGAEAVRLSVLQKYAEGVRLLFGHDHIRESTDYRSLLQTALKDQNYHGMCIILEYTDVEKISPEAITNWSSFNFEKLLLATLRSVLPRAADFIYNCIPPDFDGWTRVIEAYRAESADIADVEFGIVPRGGAVSMPSLKETSLQEEAIRCKCCRRRSESHGYIYFFMRLA